MASAAMLRCVMAVLVLTPAAALTLAVRTDGSQASMSGRVSSGIRLRKATAEAGTLGNEDEVAIRKAARKGDVGEFEGLMLQNPTVNLNAKDTAGRTALFLAAREGHLNFVKQLLDRDVSMDLPNQGGMTPLAIACEKQNFEIAQALVRKGAKLSTAAEGDDIPLLIAAGKGDENIVRLLLSSGAAKNVVNDDESTALMLAVSHPKVVEMLVEEKVSLDAENTDGVTALMLAASDGHVDVVNMLLKAGAAKDKKNSQGFTALMKALMYRMTDAATALVAKGAARDVQSKNGDTALILAVESGDKAVVKMLLADEIKQKKSNAIVRFGWGVVNRVKGLFNNRGAFVSATREGSTALHIALGSERDVSAIVQALIDAGAATDATDAAGLTPLMLASRHGHTDCMSVLLKAGAPVDAKTSHDDNERTALMIAAESGETKSMEVLVEQGASIMLLDAAGQTPLIIATVAQQLGAVTFLMKRGADAKAKDFKGLSAAQYARTAQNEAGTEVAAKIREVIAPEFEAA